MVEPWDSGSLNLQRVREQTFNMYGMLKDLLKILYMLNNQCCWNSTRNLTFIDFVKYSAPLDLKGPPGSEAMGTGGTKFMKFSKNINFIFNK